MQNPLSNISAHALTTMDAAPHEVNLIVSEQVNQLIAQANFSMDWDALYQQCPWSTPFQSADFVATWYKLFKNSYKPILIIQMRDEKLVGLLPLALDTEGRLVYAGTDIAEYQVWLANPMYGDDFIEKAILKIKSTYPGKTIPFKFVPATTPLNWIKHNSSFKYSCEVIPHKQPILKIDYSSIAKELKKKNRKEKLNRLKRLGDLRFVKVTDSQEFDAILDELAIQSDFRKGAMFDMCMFSNSATRKEFLSSLFKLNLLHVTVLKLDDTIIASNAGIFGKNWVHLQGINTHSPMYAKYSPGILLFLMLGLMLSDEQMEVFDLTPGNNGYKDMLATDYLVAYELNFHSPPKFFFNKFKRHAKGIIQRYSHKIGISTYALKSLTKRLAIHKQRIKLIKDSNNRLATIKYYFTTPKKALHRVDMDSLPSVEHVSLNENNLSDLLHYNPKGTLQTRWEFLEKAMKRLEAGQRCYTWLKDDSLLACAWICLPNKSHPLTSYAKQLPDEAYLLEELYLHPSLGSQADRMKSSVIKKILEETADATIYTISKISLK